jgi:hypothetical protein
MQSFAFPTPRLHSFRVDLSDRHWLLNNTSVSRLRRLLSASAVCTLPSGCRSCSREPENCIHISHTACVQLACRRFGKNTIEALDLLAAQAHPLLSQRFLSQPIQLLQNYLRIPIRDLCPDTDLGQMLHQVRWRLPLELQHAIFSQLSGLFCSLMSCSATLDWASSFHERQRPVVTGSPMKPLTGCGAVFKIGAETVPILDQSCLAQITIDKTTDTQICVPDEPIFGFQVSTGKYGVAALRVLYGNGTTSSWLGVPLQWFTTYRCSDLSQIRTFSDVSICKYGDAIIPVSLLTCQ